ncbi:Uma2 family endonuclease [Streptomyces misionensis]|uniref:Uma2 family endonuclease n=1 Tax=Streptomyces misionensis TaxID=67331 RepID=A0A5C6IKL4_9ACTN|nr:Uma2 family endonuclease [Streptomyces misionensis]TWV29454.1 Uma2 family endonuclease [Streptomyces misionensis]
MDEFEGDYLLPASEWDELLWLWKQTDAPKGCKVEILRGLVTIAPYSAVAHHLVQASLRRRLYEVIPDSWGVHERLALVSPARAELYVPDLAVVPGQALNSGNEYSVPVGAAELTVEITSAATARHDRDTKVAGYAAAGVPLYLLVDPMASEGPAVTLYGAPSAGIYRALASAPFGSPIRLPAPFRRAVSVG